VRYSGESTIGRRLMLILLLVSGGVLLLSTGAFLVNDWFSLRSAVFERLSAQASIVGNSSVAALMFDDTEAASSTLSSLEQEADILAAGIFDPKGRLFADFQRESGALPPTLPTTPEGFYQGHAYVVLPIVLDESRFGSIVLLSDFSYWKKKQTRNLMTALLVLFSSLVVAALLSSRLQRLVSEPILKLAATARRISEQQDYNLRAEKLSRDEIGRLVDDFNGMLRQIQQRDLELKGIQEKLEEKVQARTLELTELTRKLEHQAYHDTLTGLPNRRTFDDHLHLAIEEDQRYGGELAVLFLDLDRFKIINDTLGHSVGDKLLVQVAQRFSHCVRGSDTLARLGGDEFAVLLQRIEHATDAADVARKLIESISEPIEVEGYSLHPSTSVGISIYPSDGRNAETIIKNADAAMYRSKEQGRNRVTFFSAEMNERAERRLALENRLRQVINEGGLSIHYQPRYDTFTREIVGVEALVRWFDPQTGPVSPVEFIPLAEECGLIASIDEWVLENACREVLSWFGGAAPDITLAVNFSPAQFIREDLHKVIGRLLQQTGFPGSRLELEITESLFGTDNSNVFQIFKQLVDLDIQISVDDFGTAYSSLSRLKQLPLHTLKIDQSFVRDVGNDPDDETLVKTIITMAHNLNLKVVAEGVENDTQYRFVKENGCDAIQGLLFGKPMSGDEVGALIRNSKGVTV